MKYGILSPTTLPTNMTQRQDVVNALNQLISLIAGREASVLTNSLAEHPGERLSEITKAVSEELIATTSSGDIKALKQCQRKLESLTSLKVLTTVLMDEVDWD